MMSRVGANVVLGTLWVTVGIWMFLTGGAENQASAAVLIVLGSLFYWAAFKMYQNPSLAKKNKKSLVQQMTESNYKKATKRLKK